MEIRLATRKDLGSIRRLHTEFYDDEFPFPTLNKALEALVTVEDGEVTGFGVVRELAECVMILNQGRSPLARVRQVNSLLPYAYAVAQEAGHDGVHTFVKSEKFERVLKKHFGFTNSQGQVLYRSV
tara:strand:+ start:16624 stop:17001 length:378 start_codon:yes stop_codon:yes gene_type:complete